MERLRKGYKQTELGVIPEDWKIIPIGVALKIKHGKSQKNVEDANGTYPVLATGGKIGMANSFLYNKPSVLIGRKGTIDEPQYTATPFWTIDTLFYSEIAADYYPLFLYYKFKTIDWYKYNEASGVPSLNASTIERIEISLPPQINEQKAIAEVLGDLDLLIETLDKEIAKKRAIKEGAMQQLLTGKKRLMGFVGSWVETKAGDIFNANKGEQINRAGLSNSNNEYLVMNGGIEPSGYIDKYNNDAGAVIISEGGNSCGYVNYMRQNFWAGGHCYVISPKIEIDVKFLYATLKYYEPVIMQLRTGSGLPNIQKKRLLDEFEVYITTNTKEQRAIARVLTDMDDEVRLLENERQKYAALKQGAMQQLLTGQIRLTGAIAQSQKTVEFRTIPIAAHTIAAHIVNQLYQSKGWGRTKFQKALHLVGYHCQLDLGNEYKRNVAGPDDRFLLNYIDLKFKQYRQVDIKDEIGANGRVRYTYTPTAKITEAEQAFERYAPDIQNAINVLLGKIKTMDLARAEIVSTLYAVWNNRIIKKQPITDDSLLADFYAWSKHKSDFAQEFVLRALNWMRTENITPVGWGKYIDKK